MFGPSKQSIYLFNLGVESDAGLKTGNSTGITLPFFHIIISRK